MSQEVNVRRISTAMGAEVAGIDLADDLGPNILGTIRNLFNEHSLLVFRDQNITPQEQVAFAKNFGPLGEYPFAKGAAVDGQLTEIVKLPDETHNFGSGWHMDMAFRADKPIATILCAREVPEVGGDTMFASLKAAYRTLSPTMRDTIADLVGIHRSWPGEASFHGGMNVNFSQDELETAEHPLVSRHPETGEPFLMICPYYGREIKGMTQDESSALLGFLNAHATKLEHTCRVRWAPGTLIMWDNRCTIHNALDDDLSARLNGNGFTRRMSRVVVNAD